MWLAWTRKPHSTIEITVFIGLEEQSIHRQVLEENGWFYNYGPDGLQIYCIWTGILSDARTALECLD